ncbi:MAG: NAD-dependent epimerase/dehydratase family protein [Cyanobacteria bacterium]|nr:NAD-dependent epimerase/dehydratase family protein [Cyanobacteriota bacterium]
MKTYLITGATGYIATHLIDYLVHRVEHDGDFRIFGMSRHGNPLAKSWRSLEGDLLDPGLPRLLEELQPDIIFHLASAHPCDSLELQMKINVVGTRYLLQSLSETHQNPAVVIAGSHCEYGSSDSPSDETATLHPNTEHGIVKAAQTQVAQLYYEQYALPIKIGRIFHAYGESQNNLMITPLVSQIARCERKFIHDPKIRVRHLFAKRDYIHIQDVVSGLYALSTQGRCGEIYNIASNHAASTQEVFDLLVKHSKLRNATMQDLDSEQAIEGVVPTRDFSQGLTHKIHNHTGWKPMVTLEDGLQRELNFWRHQVSFLLADVEV